MPRISTKRKKRHNEPVAPPRGGAYDRLYALGSERMGIIDAQMLKDTPLTSIVTMLQTEWGEFKDVKPNTLLQQLKRYRDTQLIPRMIHQQQKVAEGKYAGIAQHRAQAKAMFDRLNVLDELEKLARIQKARFEKAYQREQAMAGLPIDMVSKLVEPLHRLLVSVADLQLETGLIRRAPKVMHAQVDLYADGREKPSYVVDMENRRHTRVAVGLMTKLLDTALEQEPLEGEFTHVTDRPADRSA